MRNDPLETIKKLVAERYSEAKAVFWSGSVQKNQGTHASDLDLVIVYEKLEHAYREAFIYDEWPMDAFINDCETLRYFFEASRIGSGIAGLMHMILSGQEITPPTGFSQYIKTLADQVFKTGPATWEKQQIDKERFFITDKLDDILFPSSRTEQIASAAWLYEALSQFHFRAQNKWCASGKSIPRYLQQDSPDLAQEFTQSFEKLFQTGNTTDLETLTKKILAPYGGLLWNGFKSDAPKEYRIIEK